MSNYSGVDCKLGTVQNNENREVQLYGAVLKSRPIEYFSWGENLPRENPKCQIAADFVGKLGSKLLKYEKSEGPIIWG